MNNKVSTSILNGQWWTSWAFTKWNEPNVLTKWLWRHGQQSPIMSLEWISWSTNDHVHIMYNAILCEFMWYKIQIDGVYQNKHAPKSFGFVTVRNTKPFKEWIWVCLMFKHIYPYLSNLEIHGQIYSLVKMQLPIRFPQHQEILDNWTIQWFHNTGLVDVHRHDLDPSISQKLFILRRIIWIQKHLKLPVQLKASRSIMSYAHDVSSVIKHQRRWRLNSVWQ